MDLMGLLLLLPALDDAYNAYIQSLNPVMWFRNRETAGTSAVNSGSGGSALNGTIGGTTTLGQPGKLGANEAFLFDGATSYIQVPNHALINAQPDIGVAVLVNPSSRGEGNIGMVYRFGEADTYWSFASNTMFARVRHASVNAQTQTNGAQEPTLGQWQWLFLNMSEADKTIRIYKGIAGAVQEFTYSSQVAGVGTRTAETADLFIGNTQNLYATWDGYMDEFIRRDTPFSADEMLHLVRLSNV